MHTVCTGRYRNLTKQLEQVIDRVLLEPSFGCLSFGGVGGVPFHDAVGVNCKKN